MSKRRFRTVTLETSISEPALVPATFDLFRLLARASDLNDPAGIYITVRCEFQGQCDDNQIEQLRERLNQLWIGDIVEDKAEDIKQ